MKIVLVHNSYQEKGGEDSVVDSESKLLADYGAEVEILRGNNNSIVGITGQLRAAAAVIHSRESVERLKICLEQFEPDVVHVHNWFPMLSPSIFWLCRQQEIPVVHTIHNYRLLCVKASLYRDGGPCEDCLGTRFRTPGIIHKCYRGSLLGSITSTTGMLLHWKVGTWQKAIDRFIALSEFARHKLIEGGLPAEKISVKPNCLDYDPGFRSGRGDYFLYVGRLTDEKGVLTLLRCWRDGVDLPELRIIGAGALEPAVRGAAESLANVSYLGVRSNRELIDIMGQARALICPSLWYEGMPRVVIEALAVGTPVIASGIGTYLEMINHGKTGMLFTPNDAGALRRCVSTFLSYDSPALMRIAAREEFDLHYSPEMNVKSLIGLYRQLLAHKTPVTDN